MNNKINQQKSIRVAIIGAGLGGLCLAQGLKKNNIAFDIFEKDLSAGSRTQGYRIRINETGQKALSDCLPSELYNLFVETCGLPSSVVNTLDPQLVDLSDKWVDSWDDGKNEETADLRANRLTMREVLLHGLEKNVHFKKEFVAYEESGDVVLVHFNDGTSYEADVVIAADGVNSKLCALRFSNHKLTDTGNINIYGKTFCTAAAKKRVAVQLQTGTSVIFEDEIALVIDAMQFKKPQQTMDKENLSGFALSPVEDYIYWAFIGARSRFDLNAGHLKGSGLDILSCISKLTKDWQPSLKALFELAEPSALAVTSVKTSVPNEVWTSNRITALGDAVHAMSPAGGLGANTALQDASVLALNLLKVNSGDVDILSAIKDYEEKMRTYSMHSLQASQQGGKKLYGSSDPKILKDEKTENTGTFYS